MRGWPGMRAEAYLALDFFPKGCLWHWFFFVSRQKELNVNTNGSLTVAWHVQAQKLYWLRSRQLADALLETQLNFVPACAKPLRRRHGAHANARPKTKLGCLSKSWKVSACGPPVTPMPHKTQVIHAKCGLDARACCKVIIAKDIGPYRDTLRWNFLWSPNLTWRLTSSLFYLGSPSR